MEKTEIIEKIEYLALNSKNEDIQLNSEYLNAVKEGMKSVTSGESGTAYVRFKDFNKNTQRVKEIEDSNVAVTTTLEERTSSLPIFLAIM